MARAFLVPVQYLTVMVGDQANVFLMSFDGVLFDQWVGEYNEYIG